VKVYGLQYTAPCSLTGPLSFALCSKPSMLLKPSVLSSSRAPEVESPTGRKHRTVQGGANEGPHSTPRGPVRDVDDQNRSVWGGQGCALVALAVGSNGQVGKQDRDRQHSSVQVMEQVLHFCEHIFTDLAPCNNSQTHLGQAAPTERFSPSMVRCLYLASSFLLLPTSHAAYLVCGQNL
jgi:hypothetical protein